MGGLGYWILVWDRYGSGLVLINPRLHSEGVDMYGNPMNWWVHDSEKPQDTTELLLKHKVDPYNAKVIWDE